MSQDSPFDIVVAAEDFQPCSLVLHGTLNIYCADRLHEAVIALLQYEADVVVSCEKVDQIDTAVLQLLLVLQRELQSRGRNLRLEGLSAEVRELLELAAVADTLTGQSTTQTV